MRVYIPVDIPISDNVGKFALDFGVQVMNFVTDYYKAPYPFNKLDFISDFNLFNLKFQLLIID